MALRREFEFPRPPFKLPAVPGPLITTIASIVLIVLGWTVFSAFFRVDVGPDRVGIVTNQFGSDTGEKFAYTWGQKGVMIDTLPPGNHFFNSLMRDITLVDAIDVPPGKAMILNAKYGDAPTDGRIIAEDDVRDGATGAITKRGEKGPRRRVYGPGRYRINPDAFDVQIFDATVITTTGPASPVTVLQTPPDRTRAPRQAPPRQAAPEAARPPVVSAAPPAPGAAPKPAFTHRIGVVISKVGEQPPPGQVLAEEGQKGPLRRLLGPGMYFLHPAMQDVTIIEATDVPAGYVGVVTQQVGKALPPNAALATQPDEKGVASLVFGPGTYFVNPVAAKVDLIDTRFQKLALEGTEGILFPSTDSFPIEIDLAFQWRYTPGDIPRTFVGVGDTQKVIANLLVQQARSIGRIEGSTHAGRDFIEGEPRQAFQEKFATKFAAACKEKGITISRVSVKRIVPPAQIAERMRKAVIAQETMLANKEKEQTNRIEAAYKEAQARVAYTEQQVEAETELLVRGLEAAALKEKGLLEAETEKQVAELGLTAAEIEAQSTQLLGQAEADGERLLKQAQADGLKLLVDAFGRPGAYVAYKFAESFGGDTRIMMSEEGFLEFLETIAAPKPPVAPAAAQ